MAKLSVYRKWYDIFGFFRKLSLYINEKKAGYVSVWNSEYTIQIDGHQLSDLSLRAKMDWCESEPKHLDVNVGNQIELVVSTNTFALLSLYITTGLLIIKYIAPQGGHIMLPLGLLTAMPFIYYLIIKPSKFFTITKR